MRLDYISIFYIQRSNHPTNFITENINWKEYVLKNKSVMCNRNYVNPKKTVTDVSEIVV